MNPYIINKNQQDSTNGKNFEVHNKNTCKKLPLISNQIDLGYHQNCQDAIREAKRRFPNEAEFIDGCYFCSNPCHKI